MSLGWESPSTRALKPSRLYSVPSGGEAAGVYLLLLPRAVGEKIHSYINGVVSRGV